jgi:trigger factor
MDARITERRDVAATLEITLPADVVTATFARVLSDIAREMRVPGFRPGRAPKGVVAQRIGREALAEQVRERLIDEHYPKAVQEFSLTPVHAHSHADLPIDGESFQFTVHADLFPDFTLPDLSEIVLDTSAAPIGDDDVAASVERLRREHATLVPVDRPIEAADVLTLESQGEGGQSMPVDLERTEEAIVAQLLGRSVGDELTLDLGDDPTPSEEGAEPTRRSLQVKITDVKAKDFPDPDDAFAATLGLATWDEVVTEIHRGLSAERERETARAQREELIEKMLVATPMGAPASLVRDRERQMVSELGEDLARRGSSLESYLKRVEERGEREKFEADLRSSAEQRVRRDLLLERLVAERGESVSDGELRAVVRQIALSEKKDPEALQRERGERWLDNLRFLIARDKTLTAIVAEKVAAQDAS